MIPQGLATVASTAALRQLAARKTKIEAERKATLEAAQALAKKIAETEIIIPMQASDDNHLFGSVTERIIFDALNVLGIKVDCNKIKMEADPHGSGEFDVEIKCAPACNGCLQKSKVVRS